MTNLRLIKTSRLCHLQHKQNPVRQIHSAGKFLIPCVYSLHAIFMCLLRYPFTLRGSNDGAKCKYWVIRVDFFTPHRTLNSSSKCKAGGGVRMVDTMTTTTTLPYLKIKFMVRISWYVNPVSLLPFHMDGLQADKRRNCFVQVHGVHLNLCPLITLAQCRRIEVKCR